MTNKLKNINSLIKEVKLTGEDLITLKDGAINKTLGLSAAISEIYRDFINSADELKGVGVEVPVDILLLQMERFVEACKVKDTIMMADVLNYEILDTLMVYSEIQEAVFGGLDG